jgi:hypothetical protein
MSATFVRLLFPGVREPGLGLRSLRLIRRPNDGGVRLRSQRVPEVSSYVSYPTLSRDSRGVSQA